MKKVYMKPKVVLEYFALNTHIAGDCEGIVDNPTKGSCAVLGTGGIAVFDTKVGSACVFKPTDMGGTEDQWNNFCYHVPTDYNNLFNS